VRYRDRRHHLGIRLDRHWLHDCQNDGLDTGKKFSERVASSCGIEHELRVEDILVAVGIKRDDAHAGAELEVEHVDCAADADQQIDSAESAGDSWKDNAMLEVIFSPGGVEERLRIGVSRPQGVLNIVACDRIGVECPANAAFE
jgi:hypothetical protein